MVQMKKFNYIYICVVLLLGFISNNIFAQQVNFSPRTSPQAPVPYRGVQNYNLQGDFVMLGNANLGFTTVSRRNDNTSNNQDYPMSYIDIDGDNTTVNSSTSELKLGDINPNCSEVIYAGLYWTGKANSSSETMILSTGASSTARTNGSSNFNGGYSLNITAGTYTVSSPMNNATLGTYTFSGGGVNTVFRFRSWRTTNNDNSYTGTVTVQVGSGVESAPISGTISNNDPFVFTFDEPYMINTGSQTIYISSISKRRNNISINTSYSTTVVSGGKLLDKRRVKLKKEGQSYKTVSADDNLNAIYYPSSQSAIYVGYADITDYVRQHGVGNYSVADMALVEGSNSNPGYFGGWGMVVIYKNPAMKWRDITVFDGYTYISSGTQQFDISGFRAAQNSDVNIKMGIMSGEGDRGTSGDYIQIRNRNDNNSYTTLSHGGNSTDNFFNASIYTGNNSRNPSYTNNSGIDISMFNLPNTNNVIINNNQTSTRFRYGTNGDFYTIFNVVFAVDAYVPEVVGENTPANAGTVHNSTVIPGQDLDFDLKIYNKGEEAVNNTKIEIPIPFNMHYSPTATIHPGTGVVAIPTGTTISWIPPTGAPSSATPQNTPGGKLVWTIGTLPKDSSKSILQGTLKYKLRVTENCALLATAGPCGLKVKINGKITGVGATSTTPVSSDLVRDYGAAACAGPIYDDFESTIAVSQTFIQNCTPPPVENGMLQFVAFCSLPDNEFPRAQIVGEYPWGTKFFTSQPANYDQTTDVLTGDFAVTTDGTKTTYWAVVPGMDPGCFIRLQTSLTLVTTSPTAQNIALCAGKPIILSVTRSATGVANNYQLFYYSSSSFTTPMTSIPNAAGTYWVGEGVNQNGVICTGPKVQFTVTVNPLPIVQQNLSNISICENNNTQFIVTASTPAGTITYQWEYASASAPMVWNTFSNSTYSGQITVNNASLNITNAVRIGANSINGMKVRLKVINTNGCEEFSNEVVIQIKDCRAITNPMLPNKGKKQS